MRNQMIYILSWPRASGEYGPPIRVEATDSRCLPLAKCLREPRVYCGEPTEPKDFSGPLSEFADLLFWISGFPSFTARLRLYSWP